MFIAANLLPAQRQIALGFQGALRVRQLRREGHAGDLKFPVWIRAINPSDFARLKDGQDSLSGSNPLLHEPPTEPDKGFVRVRWVGHRSRGKPSHRSACGSFHLIFVLASAADSAKMHGKYVPRVEQPVEGR